MGRARCRPSSESPCHRYGARSSPCYTAIAIAVLKVFDIIFVTTGGNLDTSVVGVRMYQEMFRFRNFGQADHDGGHPAWLR